MASRYGRKKRRQHLEKIAALEANRLLDIDAAVRAKANEKRALTQFTDLAARVESWTKHLQDLLGRYTAFTMDPPLMPLDMPPDRMRVVAIDPPLAAPDWDHPETVTAKLSHGAENLIQIVGGTVRDTMAARRLVHMTLVHGDEPYKINGKAVDWNYTISEAALQRGLTEHQIVHISEQIALQFHHRMVKELGIRRAVG